ncbi:mitofusin, partial [Blyttiomyces sp. JEL0837]
MQAHQQPQLASSSVKTTSTSITINDATYQSESSASGSTANGAIDLQTLFAEKRRKLHKLIENAKSLLEELDGSSENPLVIHYPTSSTTDLSESISSATSSSFTSGDSKLKILALNLKGITSNNPNLGSSSAGFTTSKEVNPILQETNEELFMSQLLNIKIQEAQSHLDRLLARISDTRSRVLVTGDLNAGKSTFVNAIMRREIVPDDQQPCTALFCEVVDVDQNDGIEEVHGVRDPSSYVRTDPSTFDRLDIRHLREIVEENPE